jgi:CheY-like chemotaxis protein
VDLPALLVDLHRVHVALCQARGLQCTLSLDPGLPQHVRTDGGRLRQILTNFLHNALKFTSQGRIAIEVRALGDGRWRFAVQDSGPGIAAAHLPRLFMPFSQLDDSAQRLHDGSGLGLSICRQLALAMGGDVGVSSEPGHGSRFWADLPLLPDHSAPLPRAAAAVDGPALAGMRALVVEDNPVNMLITVALLEDWGLDVAQAADGRTALACVADEVDAGRHFDVVLMDLQMPGLDGVATTRALRAAGVHTPVVALTATVFDDARAQTLAAGFVEVLCKPIDAPLLKALLAGLRQADA